MSAFCWPLWSLVSAFGGFFEIKQELSRLLSINYPIRSIYIQLCFPRSCSSLKSLDSNCCLFGKCMKWYRKRTRLWIYNCQRLARFNLSDFRCRLLNLTVSLVHRQKFRFRLFWSFKKNPTEKTSAYGSQYTSKTRDSKTCIFFYNSNKSRF